MKELDTAVLTHDVSEYRLKAGDVGTVVHRYADPGAYEVEFVRADGSTMGVLTHGAGDVRPMAMEKIRHVRGIEAT